MSDIQITFQDLTLGARNAKLISFIFLERPKHPTKPHPEIPGLILNRCDGHLIEISSSELRRRVQQKLSLNYFCPQKVIAYIEENQLYRG